jgi:hypothetical protein
MNVTPLECRGRELKKMRRLALRVNPVMASAAVGAGGNIR